MGAAVQVRIENFTGAPIAMGGNLHQLDHKIISMVIPPGFGFQAMISGSLEPPATVVTGVTRIPNTPNVIIATSVL